MTDNTMALRELLQKDSDASLLREMIGFAAQRLKELEIEPLCGAAHGERSPDRLNQRNGYRERDWGDPRWHRRASDPQAPTRQLLPGFPGAPAHRREGPDRRDPGSL